MAEDCLIAFEFNDFEERTDDEAVWAATQNLFTEMSFDPTQGHLGKTSDPGTGIREAGFTKEFESAGFTDGFDFSF